MSFTDLVLKRRSVRRFSDKPVKREDILACLEAARLAPSACNSQPWKFIVVDDPGKRARLAGRIFSGLYSMNEFAKNAPVIIAVVSEKMKFLATVGAQVRKTEYYLTDIGIAGEHFVLRARELGVPKDRKVDVVIALGYPAEDQVVPKNRKSLAEIGAFNCYDGAL
jgi:nitroreductase